MSQFEIEKRSPSQSGKTVKNLLGEPGKGGRGFVDVDVVPLCDAINEIDGCYTLQSCAGHSIEDADGGLYPGTLWLRLDNKRESQFEATAHQLAASPLIERVGKIYWGDGKETVTITFKGNESGLLAESSTVILDYFEQLRS